MSDWVVTVAKDDEHAKFVKMTETEFYQIPFEDYDEGELDFFRIDDLEYCTAEKLKGMLV